MELLLCQFWESFHFHYSVELADKGAIVVDDVDGPVDGLFIGFEFLHHFLIQFFFQLRFAEISHDCFACLFCMFDQVFISLQNVFLKIYPLPALTQIRLNMRSYFLHFELVNFVDCFLCTPNQAGQDHKGDCLILRICVAKRLSTTVPAHTGFH